MMRGQAAKPGMAHAGTAADITARLRRHLKIEAAISGAPLMGGNKVGLWQKGAAACRTMFAAIKSATNSIDDLMRSAAKHRRRQLL